MQVWNVLHFTCWKYKTQNCRIKSPSAHHRTTFSGYIFATKVCIDNWKKNLFNSIIFSRCLHNMANFGPLMTEIGFGSLGLPSKFKWVSHFGLVTAATLLIRGQPNFARCLATSWAGTWYIHFRGLLPRRNFAWCEIQFTSKSCVLLYWQRYYTALQQWASAKLCGVVRGMELPKFRTGRHL